MVPEGWERKPLGEQVKITSGGTPDRKRPEFWGGHIPWVTTAEVAYQDISATKEQITEQGLQGSSAKVFPAGSLLVAMYGQGKTRGQVGRLAIDAATNQACAALIDSGKSDLNFLYQRISFDYETLRNLANDGSQKNLSGGLLKAYSFPTPPFPEQRKIADILSTWDAAIEKTEALLATARTQKRALMQSLLTGKRRFPEFEDLPWKEVRLGDVTTLIVSNVDKKTKTAEVPVRLCNYTDVYKRDTINPTQDFMEATATKAQIKKFGLKVGDVIITKDSETADDIAMPTYVAETADDLVCGYHLAIVRPGKTVQGRFLKFYFDLPHTRYYFGTRANGAIRFGLTIDGIEGAKINLPSLEEQRRIATVIAEAEVEIEQVRKEIEKLRTEKKALMQQLLTGKRRVAVEENHGV